MSETDYNARLYEKMKAEQDKYRDWLLHQEPSEILNHTYEYTMREDIVMCMEELELEPEKARALLRSPCPLSDVYKEFRDRETEHINIMVVFVAHTYLISVTEGRSTDNPERTAGACTTAGLV